MVDRRIECKEHASPNQPLSRLDDTSFQDLHWLRLPGVSVQHSGVTGRYICKETLIRMIQ